MKKGIKILLIILEIIIVLGIIFFAIDYYRVNNNEKPIFCIKSPGGTIRDGGTIEYFGIGYKVIDFNTTEGFDDIKIGTWFMSYNDFTEEIEEYNKQAVIEAVVVEVNNNGLLVMGKNDTTELYSIGFTDEGNIGFKQGQEVSIYFDGIVMTSYPMQLGNIDKIEIIKDKSEIEIPENILRYCYSSTKNVKVSINEITKTSISISVKDTNEIPYKYSKSYAIYKKVKNENYTGIGYQIGENTGNSTAGFTGTGTEYIWKELDKNSNVIIENTIEPLTYFLPNMTDETENFTYNGWKFDWTELYGELTERRL